MEDNIQKKIVALSIGGGLAGTTIGAYLGGEFGAAIGATLGVISGFAVSTWHQIPR